jgi:hypothetical protein
MQSRGDGSLRQPSDFAQASAFTASSRAARRSSGGLGSLRRSTVGCVPVVLVAVVDEVAEGAVCAALGMGDVVVSDGAVVVPCVCAEAIAPDSPSAAAASRDRVFMAVLLSVVPRVGIQESAASHVPVSGLCRF